MTKTPVDLAGNHVFRMSSARDMLRKLERELRRLKDAGPDRHDRVDAAINFALTAWHITDWIWLLHEAEIQKDLEVQSLREFQNRLKKRRRELAVMDIIANAFKHGGTAHVRPDRPQVETILSVEAIQRSKSTDLVTLYAEMKNREWTLKVSLAGETHSFGMIAERTHAYWYNFVTRHCGMY